jgi:hypothetical protein
MYQYESDYAFVQNAHIWFKKLLHANKKVKLIPQPVFEAELARHWSRICNAAQEKPYLVFLSILSSPLRYKGSSGVMKITCACIDLLRKSLRNLVSFLNQAFFS